MRTDSEERSTGAAKVTISTGSLFVVLLQVLFIALKLCHVIDWDWWIVFLPFIIEAGITVLLLLLAVICACILSGRNN